jgi:hypothetical protein
MKSRLIVLILVIFGMSAAYSQVTTAREIKKEINYLWDNYIAFHTPQTVQSRYADGLRRFGDAFWGILNLSTDENMQTYYFAGKESDLIVMFVKSEVAEYILGTDQDEFIPTDRQHREILEHNIVRWQVLNGIDGDFF